MIMRKIVLWVPLIVSLLISLSIGCARSDIKSSAEQHVEHRFVEVGGLNWHYVEAGKGE